MNNPNDSSRFDGSMEQIGDEDHDHSFPSGVLPDDFPKRLERLKEVSGLTWSGFARAIGVGEKQIHRWRNGARALRGRHARALPLRGPDARRHGDPRERELPDQLLPRTDRSAPPGAPRDGGTAGPETA